MAFICEDGIFYHLSFISLWIKSWSALIGIVSPWEMCRQFSKTQPNNRFWYNLQQGVNSLSAGSGNYLIKFIQRSYIIWTNKNNFYSFSSFYSFFCVFPHITNWTKYMKIEMPSSFFPILITAFYVLIKLLCCECNQFSKENKFYMFMGQLVVLSQQLLPPITLNYIFTHLMWIISLSNITFVWLSCQWVSIVSIYIYYRIYTCTIYHNYVYVSIFRLFLFASEFFVFVGIWQLQMSESTCVYPVQIN